ncbi:MAG: hypothetical protein COA43_08805 [Robiginitomaculum sp.]|nr:MAG: hypothetical protein COA43_08805 [Robiginitomaculum sp.]
MLSYKKIISVSTLALLSLSMSQIAVAGEATSENGIWSLFHGAPKYKDDNGNYIKLRGRVYWDLASLSETKNGASTWDTDKSEFRTARIGIEGQYNAFKYVGEIDLSGNKTTFKDVNITYKGPVSIKFGQQKTTNSMEELTSSRHVSFTERGMITDAFGLDRRIGVSISKSGDNYSLSGGVYGNSINGLQDDKDGNTVWSARATYAPILEKGRVLHIGASLRHTDKNNGAPKRSARWGSHLAIEKIKPNIGENAFLYGLEGAAILGAFHAHAEYMNEDGDNGSAKGGFIQAGYFLTGETRKYKASGGKFDRTKPNKPLSKGGYGGLELVARYDTLDAIKAGDEKADAFTIGATWYPESHLRVKLNYTDASADTYQADGVYMRVQMDW